KCRVRCAGIQCPISRAARIPSAPSAASRIVAAIREWRMGLLPTYVDVKSAEFQRNAEVMRRLLDEFATRQEQVRQGGSERARQRHVERGKLLPRERVELLLDPGTSFLELSTLAGWDMYDNESPGGSSINGIGVVSGVECMISANEATAKGGASYPIS